MKNYVVYNITIEGFVLCKKLSNEIYAYTLGKDFVYKFWNIKASVHA